MIKNNKIIGFRTVEHNVDFCVVGGGVAGMFAAISAARHGARVAIMQDRPMFGGNASSEIRMWIRGAMNNKETGLLEELSMRNVYRNPSLNYSIWDGVMYEMVRENKNISVILNCSCCDAGMDGSKIEWIKGWQTTTQTWQKVNAKIFADCSGDSVLGPLTGAEYRMGRESSDEFGEDIAPKISDDRTMGMSCLLQARETASPKSFIPPKWANKYTCREDFAHRMYFDTPTSWTGDNYWWAELGGMGDSIADTEELRDDLLKVMYGTWDFIKNSGEVDATNWELDWMGMLPGKRESRRYVGDHIVTQHDVRAEGKFDDMIAYGGWSMDDHNPKGFDVSVKPTTYHAAPSPFGLPLRATYSKNVDNLMFAGRNISCTHSAMSASRVMGTCAVLGQAVGTAASIAVKNNYTPRDVYKNNIAELQQTLMEDDCFLPFHQRAMSEVMKKARVTDPVLFNGIDRDQNYWEGEIGSEIKVEFEEPTKAQWIEFILDSDLKRESWKEQPGYKHAFVMRHNIFLTDPEIFMPTTLLKEFTVTADFGDGEQVVLADVCENDRRLIRIPLEKAVKSVTFTPKATWGFEKARVYSVHVK